MNILETALRRIAVRKTEKAILSVGSTMAGAAGSALSSSVTDRPNETYFSATIGNVFKTIIVWVAIGMMSLLLGIFIPNAYIWTFLLYAVYKAFNAFFDFFSRESPIYKDAPIKKTDRRFTHGYKIVGWEKVKSGETFDLTDQEFSIKRVKCAVDMILAAGLFFGIYTHIQSLPDKTVANDPKNSASVLTAIKKDKHALDAIIIDSTHTLYVAIKSTKALPRNYTDSLCNILKAYPSQVNTVKLVKYHKGAHHYGKVLKEFKCE